MENKKQNNQLDLPDQTKPKDDFFDVWNEIDNKDSKRVRKFKDFKNNVNIEKKPIGGHMARVKPIMTPAPGQSYNPSTADHKAVLS